MSTILNNPFYIGLIRIRKSGEVFHGVHSPLIEKITFDVVQSLLHGKGHSRTTPRRFRYQRLLHCASCGYRLIAERQKGHVYYRCHSPSCRGTIVRQEAVDNALRTSAEPFKLTEEEWSAVRIDIDTALSHRTTDIAFEHRNADLGLAAIDDRLARLTDAYVDGIVDRDTYLQRKERLLGDRLALQGRKAGIQTQADDARRQAEQILELIKSLGTLPIFDNDSKLREILKNTTSNLVVHQKNIAISWDIPFSRLTTPPFVTAGDPHRGIPRTEWLQRVAAIIASHCVRELQITQSSSLVQKAPSDPHSLGERLQ